MRGLTLLHILSLPRPPKLIQHILPHLKRPMMTRLVHDRTNLPLLLFVPIIKHLPHPTGHILLQQHPPPSPCGPHAAHPPPDLAVVVLAPPTLEETTVPLEPAADVELVVDPAGGFPFFDRLSAGDGVFVYRGIVGWGVDVSRDVDVGEPVGGQFEVVVLDGEVEGAAVEGAPVGAAEGAFLDDLFGGFVGLEMGVGGEVEGSRGGGAGGWWCGGGPGRPA